MTASVEKRIVWAEQRTAGVEKRSEGKGTK
jgi:hypothetical protein